MGELVRDLEEKVSLARQGGSEKAVERMRSKGKLLPRERLAYLVFLILTISFARVNIID